MAELDIAPRHPSTQAGLARLAVNPNLPPPAREVSSWFLGLGQQIAAHLPDDPDLSDALRKIWEAKNCAVYLAVQNGNRFAPES